MAPMFGLSAAASQISAKQIRHRFAFLLLQLLQELAVTERSARVSLCHTGRVVVGKIGFLHYGNNHHDRGM
jgi:hypothetical protein